MSLTELRREVLERFLTLLDATSSALDSLSQLKESVLELKSALRRGNNNEGIRAYLMSKKKICKALAKCLANLKTAEKSCALMQTHNLTVRVLNKAESVSFSTLQSLISYVIGKNTVSRTRGWSLVAKLVKAEHVFSDSENVTELENLDSSLCKNSPTKAVMQQLEALDMVFYELEDGLEY